LTTTMNKEFRDPVHGFIKVDPDEMRVIDTRAFQRLRNIRQLATTFLVYPGANHTRFEHSIGVMHLSGLIFDELVGKGLEQYIPKGKDQNFYRKALRLASLIHDLGHPPFSHAGEEGDLMPIMKKVAAKTKKRANHEHYSVCIALTSEIRDRVDNGLLKTAINIAFKPEVLEETLLEMDLPVGEWMDADTEKTAILSEILTGELGSDRMDYLLRDSVYTGVKYGIFDLARLVNTLRIAPKEKQFELQSDKALGVELGGLHVAESLVICRYHMFIQVYYHKTRRILDYHLERLMKEVIGQFPPLARSSDPYLNLDDNRMCERFRDFRTHPHYQGLFDRRHFKMIKERGLIDLEKPGEFEEALRDIKNDLKNEWDFDVLQKEGKAWLDVIDTRGETSGIQKYPKDTMKFLLYDEAERNPDKQWKYPASCSLLAKHSKIFNIAMIRAYVDRGLWEKGINEKTKEVLT